MKRLFIFGTGAHARKAFHCAVEAHDYRVHAFVDEDAAAVAPIPGIPVLDAATLPRPSAGDCMFVAVGRAEARRRLMDAMQAQGWDLATLVHPSAWVASDANLDAGVLVAAGGVVESAAKIGRGAIIDIGVLIDHGCDVGAFCHLRPGEVLGPRSRREASE